MKEMGMTGRAGLKVIMMLYGKMVKLTCADKNQAYSRSITNYDPQTPVRTVYHLGQAVKRSPI